MESGQFLFNTNASHGNMLYLGEGEPVVRGGRTMISMRMQDNPNGRLFFSSPEDLFDEEYYDELYPEKKRRLTNDQVQMLEKSFGEENKLEPERKTRLAKKLGLQPRQVAVWFQNRRARWKTKQLETDYDLLKAAYDSLLSNYDSVARENEMLKSKVASLTEKFQVKPVEGAPIPGLTPEPLLVEIGHASTPPSSRKLEDRLSPGWSDTSAVVDDDCLQLIDSGDSYFPSNEYKLCVTPTTGLQLEEDDNNINNFFSNVFATVDQQNPDNESPAWWGWP